MEGLSNTYADLVYQSIFGIPTVGPATVYAALAKGAVAESDDGSTLGEMDYTGYTRIAVTNNLILPSFHRSSRSFKV